MLKLFAGGTTRALPPCILLEALATPYELVRCDIGGRERPADLLAANPLGRIPVVVDGDRVLDQSAAIMIYLAEKSGRFLPGDEPQRSEVLKFLMLVATDVLCGHVNIFRFARRTDADFTNIRRFTRDRLVEDLRFIDRTLQCREYIAGALSIADFSLLPVVGQYDLSEIRREGLLSLESWMQRMRKHPGVISAESKCPYEYDVAQTLAGET